MEDKNSSDFYSKMAFTNPLKAFVGTALLFLALSCLSACDFFSGSSNEPSPTVVDPGLNATLPTTSGFVYASEFKITNGADKYQKLLENCRRCGTKFYTQNFGNTQYHRTFAPRWDPVHCNNWLGTAFLQIDFASKTLPTQAKVLILPKYTGELTQTQGNIKGEAFEVTATAYSINSDKGFEIRIQPKDGLLGNHTLVLQSQNQHPTTHNLLTVTINYGGEKLSSVSLQEYDSRFEQTPNNECETNNPYWLQPGRVPGPIF